jgi:hypothetical protein
MTETKRLILVLGMHRGGTSAVTRGLVALGVSLGERLMPAHAVNEKGFFEDLDIYELDEALLAALGDTWHGFLPIAPERFAEPSLQPLRDQALALLRAKLAASPLYGIKDPRLPRLLPLWLAAAREAQADVSSLIVLRHPRAVAASLEKVAGFRAEKSDLLWLQTMLAAEAGTRGMRRVVVDDEAVLADPATQLRRVATALGLDEDEAATAAYAAFLDRALRHFEADDADVLPEAAQLHALLAVLARDGMVPEAAFDALASWQGALAPTLSWMRFADTTITQLQAEQARLDADLAAARARIGALEASTSWRVTAPLRALATLVRR